MENMENREIEKNQIREIRIGRFTFGITLILFGISIFIQLFFKMDMLRYVLMFWPILFVLLGIETIYLTSKKDVKIKYDIAGIFFTGFILFCGLIMSFCSLFVNNVLYNDEIKDEIIDSAVSSIFTRNIYADKVNVRNLSSVPVELEIIEDSHFGTSYINVRATYNEKKLDNVFSAISNEYNIENYVFLEGEDDDTANFIVEDVPEYITNITIKIITNNKENVRLSSNNINIK